MIKTTIVKTFFKISNWNFYSLLILKCHTKLKQNEKWGSSFWGISLFTLYKNGIFQSDFWGISITRFWKLLLYLKSATSKMVNYSKNYTEIDLDKKKISTLCKIRLSIYIGPNREKSTKIIRLIWNFRDRCGILISVNCTNFKLIS